MKVWCVLELLRGELMDVYLFEHKGLAENKRDKLIAQRGNITGWQAVCICKEVEDKE